MGRLGDWDKVERKPKQIKFSRNDELFEYFKMFLIICIGIGYLWFIFLG